MVHAEGDFLPGLIVDRYADCFVIQVLDQGMDRATPQITAALEAQFSPRAIVARNDSAVRTLEELPREIQLLAGELDGPVTVQMNGFQLEADLLQGQKTGIFLDQRENYLAAARYATGRALDCFTSTGGFALHLSRACRHVEAVDSSAPALAAAERNAEANDVSNITFREADVFDVLSSYSSARRTFDSIVLDPPAFAKSRKQIEGAMRGYKDINLRALRLLGPGGILVTCSCSHHVSEAMLLAGCGGGVARRGAHTACARTPHAGAGPSDPAYRTGNAVPEMPDPPGGRLRPQRSGRSDHPKGPRRRLRVKRHAEVPVRQECDVLV